MLYTLIPPILIVASLIGIILMLVKKSNQVANLPEDHFVKEEELGAAPAGFFGGMLWKIKNIRWDDVKHFFLAILEKIARKSRVLFLKLEARFGNLSNDIRSKRQARANNAPKKPELRDENDIIQKLKDYQTTKGKSVFSKEEVKGEAQAVEKAEEKIESSENNDGKRIVAKKNEVQEPARNASHSDAGGEREVKPIISDRIVQPRARTEIKDRLEELLIERIAINPKDIEAYERLGEYYMEIKSYNDAKECFKQVIKLNPTDRNAKYRMRRLENILAKQ